MDTEKNLNETEPDLRTENDILKLRMMAEMGAHFGGGEDIPPEVENEFLQNVMAFEKAAAARKIIAVYDFVGKPSYVNESELDDEAIVVELNRLRDSMLERGVELSVYEEYPDRLIYKFITDELFCHEMEDVNIPGMVHGFIYEEFHPNHRRDIRERAMDFLGNWFKKSFSHINWELADPFILADGRVLARKEGVKQISEALESFQKFDNCRYYIGDINFELNEAKGTGLGFAEGAVKYDGVLQDGTMKEIEGPFKLYMSSESGWWSIFYFVFPGFEWELKD